MVAVRDDFFDPPARPSAINQIKRSDWFERDLTVWLAMREPSRFLQYTQQKVPLSVWNAP